MQSNSIPSDSGRKWLRRLYANLPLLALIVLVGLIVVLQSWIHSAGEVLKTQKAAGAGKAPDPINVVALTLHPGPLQNRINLPGVVRPWVTLKVVAEVPGTLVAKPAAEGRHVQKGAVLAAIDDRDYRHALASATASYNAAKASHDRFALLFKDDLVTRAQLDDAVALVHTSRAAMDMAALNLERCAIRAPMAGVVDRLPVEIGQYLAAADPVATILEMDRVKVEVGIPESDVDAVRTIEEFDVRIDALKGRTFKGRRHFLASSTDTLARTYRLEIAVDNPQGVLLADMFARVDVVKERVENALSVPLFALVTHQNAPAVFVAEAGKARIVPVRTGIQDGWQVQIGEGLSAGDKVIVVGQREARQDAPVTVVRTIDSVLELDQ